MKRKPKVIICEACGKEKNLAARGMCMACYQKDRKHIYNKREYGSQSLGTPDVHVTIPCMRCGSKLDARVPKGEEHTVDMRRLCQKCKSVDTEDGFLGYREMLEAKRRRGPDPHKQWVQEEVKVFKPGDRGFAKRAAQCTPPSEIKGNVDNQIIPHRYKGGF